jgi:hypothetical protein
MARQKYEQRLSMSLKDDPKWLEQVHGHCATALMDDYGVAKKHRLEILKEIQAIYDQQAMIHSVIITGVRGWKTVPSTYQLRHVLDSHKTHAPKNHKPSW